MRKITVVTEIYDWKIIVLDIKGKKDIPELKKLLIKFDVPKDSIKNILHHVKKGHWGGDHIFSRLGHESMVCLENCNTIEKKTRALFHELRHVQDRILETMNVNDSEAAAFLSGYIAQKVVPIFFKLK